MSKFSEAIDYDVIFSNVSKKLTDEFLTRHVETTFSKPSESIMCRCLQCGGIGYAKDESLLDRKGFLKDMKCPCGGRIKKVF